MIARLFAAYWMRLALEELIDWICHEKEERMQRAYRDNEKSRLSIRDWDDLYQQRDIDQELVDQLNVVLKALPKPILHGTRLKFTDKRRLNAYDAVLPYIAMYIVDTQQSINKHAHDDINGTLRRDLALYECAYWLVQQQLQRLNIKHGIRYDGRYYQETVFEEVFYDYTPSVTMV